MPMQAVALFTYVRGNDTSANKEVGVYHSSMLNIWERPAVVSSWNCSKTSTMHMHNLTITEYFWTRVCYSQTYDTVLKEALNQAIGTKMSFNTFREIWVHAHGMGTMFSCLG